MDDYNFFSSGWVSDLSFTEREEFVVSLAFSVGLPLFMLRLTILVVSVRYSQILFRPLTDIRRLNESVRHLFRNPTLVISRLSIGIFDGFQW